MKRNLARAEGKLQKMIDILAGIQRHKLVQDWLRWWLWTGNRDEDESDDADPLTDEEAPLQRKQPLYGLL